MVFWKVLFYDEKYVRRISHFHDIENDDELYKNFIENIIFEKKVWKSMSRICFALALYSIYKIFSCRVLYLRNMNAI